MYAFVSSEPSEPPGSLERLEPPCALRDLGDLSGLGAYMALRPSTQALALGLMPNRSKSLETTSVISANSRDYVQSRLMTLVQMN